MGTFSNCFSANDETCRGIEGELREGGAREGGMVAWRQGGTGREEGRGGCLEAGRDGCLGNGSEKGRGGCLEAGRGEGRGGWVFVDLTL